MRLGALAGRIGSIVGEVMTGISEKMRSIGKTAGAGTIVKEQERLAKAVTAVGKAAKGSLASFDKLDVLEQKTTKSSSSSSGKKPGKEEGDTGKATVWSQMLSGLKKALEPLTEELFAGLKWGYEEVLAPLGRWAADSALPAFLEMVGGAANYLAAMLELLKPVGTWLWDNFLQPMASWSGDVMITAMNTLATAFELLAAWIDENKTRLLALWEAVEPVIALMSGAVALALDTVKVLFDQWSQGLIDGMTAMMDILTGILTGDWEMAWQGVQEVFAVAGETLIASLQLLWQGIQTGFTGALNAVKAAWQPIAPWFQQYVMTPLNEKFGWLWDGVALAGRICWNTLTAMWQQFVPWFTESVATPAIAMTTDTVTGMLTLLKDGFQVLFDILKDAATFALTIFGSVANILIDVFNFIISALNRISVDIPDWVPEYGGRSFGVSIPKIEHFTIPKLAAGAVIPPNAEFAAILGDQHNGRNLEAPEGLIREIVREESGGREITIRFEGTMAQLVRVLKPELEAESLRQGARLINGMA